MDQPMELEEALQLVEEMCRGDQIKSLLRRRKDRDNVRITADNKDQLITRNLKDAVEKGAVSLEDVFDLIRTSEENGGQHIWYYRLRAGLSHLLEFEQVAERLYGRTWKKAVSAFPSLKLKPEGYVISDFRKSVRKPRDWYLKIYGHTLLTQATGKIEEKEDGLFWKEYKKVPLRTVILIRWNSPDILEIRVGKNESRKRIDDWQRVAWSLMRTALTPDQFRPWNLTKPLTKIVEECDKHTDLYTFRDAGVLDKGEDVLAHFETISDQGNLLESQRTVDAIKAYVADGGKLKGLAITWLAEKTALTSEVRTLVGAKNEHELLVPAHCSAEDIDHVTDQFRRFSK